MTDQPERDHIGLAQEMDYAAHVLEQANKRYNLPSDTAWKASSLRREAYVVADEDKDVAERSRRIEELARELFAAQKCYMPEREDLESWTATTTTVRSNCLALATNLIESGWAKP